MTQQDVRVKMPLVAGEREMLTGALDFQRATLLHKINGVSEEKAREAVNPPSTLTFLGLVKHLGYVERWWFQAVFTGKQDDELDFVEDDFLLEPHDTLETIIAFYKGEVEMSRRITEASSLDDLSKLEGFERNLRWILVHMIEETARHNGHADFLREAIDGATGQ